MTEAYEKNHNMLKEHLNDTQESNEKRNKAMNEYFKQSKDLIEDIKEQRDHYADRVRRLEQILGS